MKKYTLITVFTLFLLIHTALAVEITTTLPVEAPQTNPSEFIIAFYKYALSIGGVLAFGVIVWGGIRYTFAAGNPSGQTEGKEWIKAALWGLALLVSIFLLLNTVNPELTKLVLPDLGKLPEAPGGGGAATSSHFECHQGACIRFSGAGTDNCNDCGGTPQTPPSGNHYGCVQHRGGNPTCDLLPGSGISNCTPSDISPCVIPN